MATQPVFVPIPDPPGPVPVVPRPKPRVTWDITPRTIVLIIIMIVCAYVADYYDDAYLIARGPIEIPAPQGGVGNWSPSMYAAPPLSGAAKKPGASADGAGDPGSVVEDVFGSSPF